MNQSVSAAVAPDKQSSQGCLRLKITKREYLKADYSLKSSCFLMPASASLKMYHPSLFDPAGFWWWNIFVVLPSPSAWHFPIQLSFWVTVNGTYTVKSAIKQNQFDWLKGNKNSAADARQVQSFKELEHIHERASAPTLMKKRGRKPMRRCNTAEVRSFFFTISSPGLYTKYMCVCGCSCDHSLSASHHHPPLFNFLSVRELTRQQHSDIYNFIFQINCVKLIPL